MKLNSLKTVSTLFISISIGIVFAILLGCEKEMSNQYYDTYQLSLDGRLDTNVDGLYKLKLNSSSNSIQTIHRITGKLLQNGEEPNPPQLVEWESSHSWTLNDTAYVFIRRFINYLGEWVNVDTVYVTGHGGGIVPTINKYSYSGTGGEINTVIAPIDNMVGDTMIIRATFKDLTEIILIILE
jgi:hypothetical protein